MAKQYQRRQVHLAPCDQALQEFIEVNVNGMLGPAFLAACIRRGFDAINLTECSPYAGEPAASYEVRLGGDANDDIVRCLDECVKPRQKGTTLGLFLKKGAEVIHAESANIKIKDIVDEYLSQAGDVKGRAKITPKISSANELKAANPEVGLQPNLDASTVEQPEDANDEYEPDFGVEVEVEEDNLPTPVKGQEGDCGTLLRSLDGDWG